MGGTSRTDPRTSLSDITRRATHCLDSPPIRTFVEGMSASQNKEHANLRALFTHLSRASAKLPDVDYDVKAKARG